jgi:hypothetical protein
VCVCATSPPRWTSPSAAPTRIATELADAGYLVKNKDGRRNHYEIHGHLPLRGTTCIPHPTPASLVALALAR